MGCNLFSEEDFGNSSIKYIGIGRGKKSPGEKFLNFVYDGFRIVERGFANEIKSFSEFANSHYANDEFNKIDFKEIQKIASTCVTGCDIADPGPIEDIVLYDGFIPRLVKCAKRAWDNEN